MSKGLQVYKITIAAAFFGCLLCLCLPSIAQLTTLPRFKNFNSQAFASSEVKAVTPASDGSIWVATAKGLYILNGGIITEQQLPEPINKNLNSLLEHRGVVYAGANNGVAAIQLQTRQAQLLPVLKQGDALIAKYCMVTDVNSNNELLFYTGYDTSAYFSYNLQTQKTNYLFNKSDGYRALQKDANGQLVKLWAVEASGLLEHEMDGYRLLSLHRIFLGQNNQPLLKFGNAALDAAGTLWCTTDKGLLQYETRSRRFQLLPIPNAEALTDVAVDGALVYCATRQAGIVVFNKRVHRFTDTILHIPDDPYSLGSNEVLKLHISPGGLLVAVTANGISCLPLHPALQLVSSFNAGFGKNTPNLFQKQGEDLLVAGGLQLKRFSASYHLKDSVQLSAAGEKITSLLPFQNGVVATTQSHIFLWKNGALRELKPQRGTMKARSLLFVISLKGDTLMLAGGDEGLFEVNLQTGSYQPFRATATDNYQQFQYAALLGQRLMVNTYYSYIKLFTPSDTGYRPGAEIETFSNLYDHLPLNNDEMLLAANTGMGLLNLQKNSYTKISPAFTKSVYRICVAAGDTLLVTEAGLYRYANRQVIDCNYPLNSLVKPSGPGGLVFTGNGLQVFENGELIQLPINVAGLLAANKMWMNIQPSKTATDGAIRLPANDRKWLVEVALNNYHPFIDAGWQYQLLPADGNWQAGEASRLQFENLAAGSYQLKIRALSGGKAWLSKQMAIEVLPAWYQSAAFKLAIFLLVFACFLLLYRFSIRRFKQKAREKEAVRQRILELESKAFRAQMNPHFVFNTLNSINSCILEKQTDKASDFLTQFSRLIRLTLDNSNQDLILLEKELETVRLYLSIEQKRLEEAFEFDIKTDPALRGEEWRVPPMIIQPFIENAIWHGLVHKRQHGRIAVSVMLAGDCLQVTIEDNGIGRQQAAELKSGRGLHNSLGTTLTLQRLQVFHPKNAVAFTDLFKNDGEAAGTLVTITIHPIEI